MKREFVPLAESITLKELGYNEPHFGYYLSFGSNRKNAAGRYGETEPELFYDYRDAEKKAEQIGKHIYFVCDAPLWQQAFRWLKEKHGLSTDLAYGQEHGALETLQALLLTLKK